MENFLVKNEYFETRSLVFSTDPLEGNYLNLGNCEK